MKRRPGKQPCHVCGFEDTSGRCVVCHKPVCVGCAMPGSEQARLCPDCPREAYEAYWAKRKAGSAAKRAKRGSMSSSKENPVIYDDAHFRDVVEGMRTRYSSPKVAADMASFHAADYPPSSEQHAFWVRVSKALRGGSLPNPISTSEMSTAINAATEMLSFGATPEEVRETFIEERMDAYEAAVAVANAQMRLKTQKRSRSARSSAQL